MAKLENQQSASFQIEKKKVNEDGDDDKEEEVGRKSLENIVDFCMRVCVCFPFPSVAFCLFFSHTLPLASLFFVGRRFSAAICTYIYT